MTAILQIKPGRPMWDGPQQRLVHHLHNKRHAHRGTRIVQAVGAVKFQINPTTSTPIPKDMRAKTREQRILEYIEANPRRWWPDCAKAACSAMKRANWN